MQDFIKMVVDNLGTDEKTARSATGGLLGLIQKHADKSDADELMGKLPGAADLLKEAAGGGGGLLGGIASQLGSAIGGSAGSALSVAGVLKGSGLDSGMIGQFVTLFFNFAKQKAGQELIGRLLSKIPDLAKLAS
jgi:hypothetical protein